MLKRKKLLLVLGPIGLVALLPAYLAALTVAGPSEAPTLLLGDRVLVNKAAYGLNVPYTQVPLLKMATPRRGDLVLFFVPNRGYEGIKRVVALPGDTVEMRENQLYLNGEPVAQNPLERGKFDRWVPAVHHLGSVVARESSGNWITYTPGKSSLRSFAQQTVPEGHYFLLGDHRDDSNDSRVFGAIDAGNIRGHVVGLMQSTRPAEAWPPR